MLLVRVTYRPCISIRAMFDIFSVKEKLQAMLNTDKDFTDEDIEKVLIFPVFKAFTC